jgi:thiosulfate/3-mercaptopyruvate sulfurtransferase
MDTPAPLVSADWLRAHLDDVRVVDCRFVLGDPEAGRRLYLEGHVPGAAFLDLDTDLADPPGAGGRHPLPERDRFAATARRAGISAGTTVVAYDQHMTGGAARLWWLLRHHGHARVTVLDGGLEAWNGPLARGEEDIPEGDFYPASPRDDLVNAEELRGRLGDPALLLLDARVPERFRGDVEPIDPVPGHIPGAVNLPFADALPAPAEAAASAREIVAYCGSGVTACVLLLSLAAAGRDDARLYPGSWSEWSGLGFPVETG